MGLFVRKVKTSSGATAVQIARKHHGVRTIVEHIGSAHDDGSLAALMQVAKDRIDAGQLAFDLDALTPGSPVTAAPTVVGSTSRVLWAVLEGAYARLGFDTVDDDVFRKLVLARVVEPTSKRTRSGSWTSSVSPRRRCGRSGGCWPARSSRIGGTRSVVLRTRTRRRQVGCRWCSTT